MLILLFFSFLAGVVTVLSPCVLPVLPALLSAGGGTGRLRPYGIILGLIASFTFFTLLLTAIVNATGISAGFLRYIAIALIAFFGLLMIFPTLGDRFARLTSNIADIGQSLESKSKKAGSGFWGGLILGAALGLVWTPCAGPILAAITTLAATNQVTWGSFLITLAYSLGAAIPMLLIIFGGKKIINASRLSGYTETIRRVFGFLMILAALALGLHYDVKLQQMAIQYIPLLTIEDNALVRNELDKLRQGSASNKDFILSRNESSSSLDLPKIAKVPELSGITGWVNTEPFTFKDLQGKVVLVDFWTYSCINCIRTFPYLKDWYEKYKDKGFVIVGVHSPEFAFEKDPANVKEAAKRFGLTYPIPIDGDFKTWQNFNNSYWPAHYLVDQEGIVRSFHFGEGAYMETENQIRKLLGLTPLDKKDKIVKTRPLTPETYLGFERGFSYAKGITLQKDKEADYRFEKEPADNQVALQGKWLVEAQKITSLSDEAALDFNILGSQVYLVMESKEPKGVAVLLDGKPLDRKYETSDMNKASEIIVSAPRKYDVIDLKSDYGRHLLTLKVPKGVSLYAFTFGDENVNKEP